jgi:threonine synthase
MKVVEALSERYNVALLNSKNAWRILGQESYPYEIAQDFEYDLSNKVVVVPIGNAGNISAIMSGFLKFLEIGIIDKPPKIIGVQSEHANPVFKYFLEPDVTKRKFFPVVVKSSVAQAAMIGNPVSMPRVIHLAEQYNRLAEKVSVFVVQVTEKQIMDWELIANRNGHIACPHGGECLAGIIEAKKAGLITSRDVAVLDSTAHTLKFAGFQEMYFSRSFPDEYEISYDDTLINVPTLVKPQDLEKLPAPGKPLIGDDFQIFVDRIAEEIAKHLDLKKV